MSDSFSNYTPGLAAPGSHFAAVTPNDNSDLANVSRGIEVGTSGDVAVIGADDSSSVVVHSLAAGIFHPMRVKRILATGTTATNITVTW